MSAIFPHMDINYLALYYIDDEEREKLAKEMSKDWNSGTGFSKFMFFHCIRLLFVFLKCEILSSDCDCLLCSF